MLLPDSLVYMLLWGGMLASVMDIITVTPLQSVLGITVSWCIMFSVMKLYKMIRSQDGLGNGDVKLYSAVSAWLGLDLLPQLILISSILGCVFYLVVRVYYAVKPGDTEKLFITEDKAVPFGPAIALAALILFHVNVMVF
jgi:leader peptidase (prepilin peptidase)/N-methyltransferase